MRSMSNHMDALFYSLTVVSIALSVIAIVLSVKSIRKRGE